MLMYTICYEFQVQKIHIEYARTAKRLDIKKLKHRMWEILTPEDNTKDVRLLVNDLKFERLFYSHYILIWVYTIAVDIRPYYWHTF